MAIDQPAGVSRARILVVDDHPMNLSAFRRLLHSHYEVLAAPSGERALEIVAGAAKPDLILLDVMMPGMNGLQVLERLREDPLTRAIPVILVTVLDTQDSHAEGFRAGAVDFIAKPFGPDIVLARIATHLALKKATDELAACRNSAEELRDLLRSALGAAQSPSGLDDDRAIEVMIGAGKARSLLAAVEGLLDVSA